MLEKSSSVRPFHRLAMFGVVALTALSLSLSAAASGLADVFSDYVDISVSGFQGGTNMLTNFPLLVSISAEKLPGFDYSGTGIDGSDIRFEVVSYRENYTIETQTSVPHEIEKWDAAGESRIWVKLPQLNNNARRVLRMDWNLAERQTLPLNDESEVWPDYSAVWHFSGAALGADSKSGNASDFGAATAVEAGLVGAALSAPVDVDGTSVSSGASTIDALKATGFTASMWLRLDSAEVNGAYPFVFGRVTGDATKALAAARFTGGTANDATKLTVYPGVNESGAAVAKVYDLSSRLNTDGSWSMLAIGVVPNEAGDGGKIYVAINGYEFDARDFTGAPFTDGIAIETTDPAAFPGAVDEVRVRPGVIEQKRATFFGNEFAQMTNAVDYLAFGNMIENGKAVNFWTEEPSLSKTVWTQAESAATVSMGASLHGEVQVEYRNRNTDAVTTAMPTGSGYYEARFFVSESDSTWGLEKTVQFQIKKVVVEGIYATAADFAYSTKFWPSAAVAGSSQLNFPFLVRLSNNQPSGFAYDKLVYGSDTAEEVYADVRFFDQDGEELMYEIDTWNPAGESLIWVKVPCLDAETKITMCWGCAQGKKRNENSPEKVWSGYTGVWHLSETITAATSAATLSADSTGHGLDATPKAAANGNVARMISRAGQFGNARIIDSQSIQKGNYLEIPEFSRFAFGGKFTLSCWVKIDNYSGWPVLMTTRDSNQANSGFYVEQNYSDRKKISVRGQGSTQVLGSVFPSEPKGMTVYTALTLVFDGDIARIYSNGAKVAEGAVNEVADNTHALFLGSCPTSEYATCGSFDEVRLMKGVLDDDRIAAIYKQESDAAFTSSSAVQFDASIVMQNGWLREPSLKDANGREQTEWAPGATEPTVDVGLTRGGGVPTVKYYNRQTGELIVNPVTGEPATALPTELGDYRAVFTFAGGGGWSALEKEISFHILVAGGGHDLGDGSDRVMLANDDDSAADADAKIWYQSYDVTESGWGVPYWRHIDTEGEIGDDPFSFTYCNLYYNFFAGSKHEYRSDGGEDGGARLWFFDNVRMGNLFPNEDQSTGEEALASNQNFLPWNPLSKQMLGSFGYPVGDVRSRVGTFVLRNAEQAGVYSSCYTDGIGTVYFDAVNAFTDNVGNGYYRIKLQLCTTLTEVSGLQGQEPTDDNVRLSDSDDDVSSYYGNAEWEDVAMTVYEFNGSNYEKIEVPAGDGFELAVTDGGRTDRFYRFVVPIKTSKASRFRIIRTAIDPAYTYVPDAGALIILDNLIVSTPTTELNIIPCGACFSEKTGRDYRGWEGTFDPAYPSVTDDSIFGLARIVDAAGQPLDSDVLTTVAMHYRWHYLDQLEKDWQILDMAADGAEKFRTLSALAGLDGTIGDLEFWYDGVRSSRDGFYEYYDYTGGDYGVPGYREGGLDIEGGTHYTTRMRFGKSTYGEVRVITRPVGSTAAVTNTCELIADGSWRGLVKTPLAYAKGLEFRIEGVNPQAAPAAQLSISTDYYVAVSEVSELPQNVNLVTATANDWQTVPCDAKTGYLLFRITEGTAWTLAVSRADWQDFNLWSSAVNTNALFVGSSLDTNSVSSISTEYDLDMSKWKASVSTNSFWTEYFAVSSSEKASSIYPREESFSTKRSRNGWTVENAMWVWGKWANEPEFGGDSAAQLEGRGKGRLSFINAASAPNGIDTVKYHARLAQFNEFDNFTYYNAITWNYQTGSTTIIDPTSIKLATSMSNYAILTKAALTEEGADSYDGDGSISLVGYYHPQYGAYEFRISRGATQTELKLALYKWYVSGNEMKCDYLGYRTFSSSAGSVDATYLVHDTANNSGGLLFSVEEYTDGSGRTGTLINAGVRCAKVANGDNTTSMDGQPFSVVTYFDTTSTRLTAGSYGFLGRNCPCKIINPVRYDKGVGFLGGTVNPNSFNQYTKTTVTNSGSPISVTTTDDKIAEWYEDWVIKPGRTEKLTNHPHKYGFQAITDISQKVVLEITPTGESDWQGVVTNTITGFVDQLIVDNVKVAQKSDVRLQVLGDPLDTRTDVVINDVELTQWTGEWTDEYSDRSMTNQFVYTAAWVKEDLSGNKTLLLQPTRATKAEEPVSLRSPMVRGYGLFHFEWKNADSRAKLLLQTATAEVTWNRLTSLTEAAPSSSGWTTVETFDFSELGSEGYKTIYFNRRYPPEGLMRLVVAQDVVEAAIDPAIGRYDPDYGKVEITDAFVWDLPEYDERSWSGWNFRAAGWDGTESDEWANLVDMTHGLSGILNNTLDETTLAEKFTDYYKDRVPNVQSPTFTTNYIGLIEFSARVYSIGDPAAYGHYPVLTIYGSDNIDETTGEPLSWDVIEDVVISNSVYTSYSVKVKSSGRYQAVRFGVKGVPGVTATGTPLYDPALRVAIDDLLVSEQPAPSLVFRNLVCRPFRDSDAIAAKTAVADIASQNEQPLAGETFGFQAEVMVQSDDGSIALDDAEHPVSVDLWYYVGEEPWGYANWKDSDKAVRVTLTPAESTNLVYRSMREHGLSLVKPQLLEESEPYRIVQYHLVANYYGSDGEAQDPHDLNAKEWTMPTWYRGFDDPNSRPGADFSAYTILEKIAPKRAWINEVNFCEDTLANSRTNQWVELAIPADIDMTDWKLRVYDYPNGGPLSTLLTIGRNETPSKKGLDTADPVSHYCFYTVKSPSSTLTTDATWPAVTEGSIESGRLNWTRSYGFELVRPNGIIEHEAVVQGFNQRKQDGYRDWAKYEGTNIVNWLEAQYGGDWVWADEDFKTSPGATVGVITNTGAVHAEWKSPMKATPNALNDGQYIAPDWFLNPNGDFVWLYFTVTGEHMRQIFGGNDTNTAATVTINQGQSTNVVYEVDRWYELGDLTVSGETSYNLGAPTVENGKSYYRLDLVNVSNRTDISVSAAIRQDLRDLGVDENNEYTPAIMNWLTEGTVGGADGGAHPFKGDTIEPVYYRGVDGSVQEELSVTDVYWLDLDPTEGNWELWGGMGEPNGGTALGQVDVPIERQRTVATGVQIHTNRLTTVWLELTNTVSGVAYPPYRMQGLGNEKSDLYTGVWTSANFKVTMCLLNGKVDSVFQPMRFFVFNHDSFRPADDPEAPFSSRIEIIDPFSEQSPASEWGWKLYWDCTVGTSWAIDRAITPGGVKTLNKQDTFESLYD